MCDWFYFSKRSYKEFLISIKYAYICNMEKIFHIPHSSIIIPEKYINEYSISKTQLEDDAITLCDIRTDEMIEGNTIIFPYSRLFCDVERFNSNLEPMNKIEMGVLYKVNHKLETIRKEPSNEILSHYDDHHKKLNDITKEKLKDGDVLFIDLHSFSNKALPYELHKNSKRPDICLGINTRYNKNIIEKIIYIIEKFNYSFVINEPFIGCLLPSDYINDVRVHGVMIDINKNIYNTDSKFEKIKDFLQCVKEI